MSGSCSCASTDAPGEAFIRRIKPRGGAAHELTHSQSKAIKDLPDLFPSESTANLFAVYVQNI
jgi:hypothetical protein